MPTKHDIILRDLVGHIPITLYDGLPDGINVVISVNLGHLRKAVSELAMVKKGDKEK